MQRLALVLAGVCALVIGGTSAASTPGKIVKVSLHEYSVVAPKSVGHGKVTFVVTNKGMHEHEFVVVKTKKDGPKLLKNGKADETGARGEVEDLGPGKTKRLTLTLPAGHYVLLCNTMSHYKKGMGRNFTVW